MPKLIVQSTISPVDRVHVIPVFDLGKDQYANAMSRVSEVGSL